jgi:hypothetical protein
MFLECLEKLNWDIEGGGVVDGLRSKHRYDQIHAIGVLKISPPKSMLAVHLSFYVLEVDSF